MCLLLLLYSSVFTLIDLLFVTAVMSCFNCLFSSFSIFAHLSWIFRWTVCRSTDTVRSCTLWIHCTVSAVGEEMLNTRYFFYFKVYAHLEKLSWPESTFNTLSKYFKCFNFFFTHFIKLKIYMLMFLNDVVWITVYSNALWVNGAKNTLYFLFWASRPQFHMQNKIR